jgi:hypothetical protein
MDPVKALNVFTPFAYESEEPFVEGAAGGSNGRLFKGVTVIQSGLGNARDRHFYTPEALKEAVNDGLFEDLSAYVDHPTKIDEEIQPERTFKDLVGIYRNPRFVEGANGARVVADFHVLKSHNWLAEGIRDLVGMGLGKKVGVSILGSGRTSPGKHRLEETGETIDVQRVDKFTRMRSADIVTQAGAGGGFQNLSESAVEAVVRERKDMNAEEILAKIQEAAAAKDADTVQTLSAQLKEMGAPPVAAKVDAVAEATDEDDEDEETEEAEESAVAPAGKVEEKGGCSCGGMKEASPTVLKRAARGKGGKKFAEADSEIVREVAQLRKDNAKLQAQLDAHGIASYINTKIAEADFDEKTAKSVRARLRTMTDKAQIDAEIEYHNTLRESLAEEVLSRFDRIEGAGGSNFRETAGGGTTVADKLQGTITASGLTLKAQK